MCAAHFEAFLHLMVLLGVCGRVNEGVISRFHHEFYRNLSPIYPPVVVVWLGEPLSILLFFFLRWTKGKKRLLGWRVILRPFYFLLACLSACLLCWRTNERHTASRIKYTHSQTISNTACAFVYPMYALPAISSLIFCLERAAIIYQQALLARCLKLAVAILSGGKE